MKKTVQERVAAGAALLDEYDVDWWECIDLPTLNLESWDRCILGQWADANFETELYSSGYGLGKTKLSIAQGWDFGFAPEDDERQLEKAWAEAILWREHLADSGELA